MKLKIKNNKSNKIAGMTLAEILIGMAVTSIIMIAVFTSYTLVNNSYTQVTDRAKISSSGRDMVGMMMRDIRMAGFKYRLGTNALDFPNTSYLQFNGGDTTIVLSHDPIIIEKNVPLGFAISGAGDPTPKHNDDDKCCDRIHIVYDDFNQNDTDQPYKRYKITYYALPVSDGGDARYAAYKTVQSWSQNLTEEIGEWISDCSECYVGQKIRDHIVDMEFIPLDAAGRKISPLPKPGSDTVARENLYKIRAVDVRLTFRSKKEFYRFDANADTPRFVKALGDRTQAFLDKYLRDSVVVTIHTRNIGSGT